MQLSIQTWVLPSTFTHPQASYHVLGVFVKHGQMLTHQARNTPQVMLKTSCRTCVATASHHTDMKQSCQDDWFHSLPFQQFQALLTLFSKSFSPFPHGTCLLSVSSHYLALDEIYHPLCAPIPRNVTLRKHTVLKGLQMTHRILTHNDALFQEAYICASVGDTSRGYNSRPEAPISMPSLSLFIRHY
jgi:hypothetical protein